MSPNASIPAGIPRAALVTGGAQRLGRAIALALADAGFRRRHPLPHQPRRRPRRRCAEIRAVGRTRRRAAGRPRRRGARSHRCCRRPTAALGPIGVLVNNASAFERDEWHDATRAKLGRATSSPNLRAPFVLMQHFAHALPADGRRRGGQHAGPAGLVADPAFRLLHRRQGRAVGADPDAWRWRWRRASASTASAPAPPCPARARPRRSSRGRAASVPLGHGTSPEEVARAVLAILALPAMTGQMIALDGGQHLQWNPPARTAARE